MVQPRPASEEELLTFHLDGYVDVVRRLSAGEELVGAERFGFSAGGDNPVYAGMYEAALLSTGASVQAACLVADGTARAAFAPAGGLHHAASGHASGFCIFNDPVVAINALRKRGLRVAYVDIDAHHGDGVQAAFYGDRDVMTISMHEGGRWLFPGTGEVSELGEGDGQGYSVNVPLYPYTYDELFLEVFDAVVPPLGAGLQPGRDRDAARGRRLRLRSADAPRADHEWLRGCGRAAGQHGAPVAGVRRRGLRPRRGPSVLGHGVRGDARPRVARRAARERQRLPRKPPSCATAS